MSAPTTRRALLAGAPVAALIVGAAPAFTAEHPDADMIRTCQSLAGALSAYEACEGADEADAGDAYERLATAIDEVRPQTLDGMVAKAKAAIEHASQTPGLDVTRGERSSVAEGWAWDLMHDLLRLHSGSGRG